MVTAGTAATEMNIQNEGRVVLILSKAQWLLVISVHGVYSSAQRSCAVLTMFISCNAAVKRI